MLKQSIKYLFRFSQIKDIDIKKASLLNILKNQIIEKGPITFPQFWQQALLHEKFGYYMKQDVFNKEGDFVTSVEISQIFNEIIAIWLINTFQHIRVLDQNLLPQKQMHILELGPGLGTLSSNVFRVFSQFNLLNNVQYTFIEFSDFMRKKQQDNVLKQLQVHSVYPKYEHTETKGEKFTSPQVNLRWYKTYEEFIQDDFSLANTQLPPVLVIAHEFFDALPVHLFQYHQGQWLEKLVNMDAQQQLQFVLSDGPTQNVEKILNPKKQFSQEIASKIKDGDTIEICPQGLITMNSIAEMIGKIQGAALIVDYGEKHAFSNSVRAIRKHKIMNNVLDKPGDCDISAYVNFLALEEAATQVENVKVPELLTQADFLEQMGIQTRLQILCKNANKANERRLQSEYERLVNTNQMGSNFKFMCVQHKNHGHIFPFIQDAQQIYY